MNPDKKPAKPLQDSVEFLTEVSDSILKVTTESEILDDVPVISWITKAYAIKEAFQLRRLRRNCEAFLNAARAGDSSKLAAQLVEVAGKPSDREKLVDTFLQILLEAEKPLKAEIFGRLLVALADGRLTFEEFDELSLLVLAASIPALQALPKFFCRSGGGCSIHARNVGSTEALLASLGVASRYGTMLTVNDSGRLIFQIGFLGHAESEVVLTDKSDTPASPEVTGQAEAGTSTAS